MKKVVIFVCGGPMDVHKKAKSYNDLKNSPPGTDIAQS